MDNWEIILMKTGPEYIHISIAIYIAIMAAPNRRIISPRFEVNLGPYKLLLKETGLSNMVHI